MCHHGESSEVHDELLDPEEVEDDDTPSFASDESDVDVELLDADD